MQRRRASVTILALHVATFGFFCGSEAAARGTALDDARASSALSAGPGDSAGRASVQILWDAPAECPSGESVRRYAEWLLGQRLSAPRAQQVLARAKVRRNAAGNWELWLSLTSDERESEQTLVAKQCAALGDATALKVALATDPVATARSIEQSTTLTAPEPGPEPDQGVQKAAPNSGARAHRAPGSVGMRLNLGTGLAVLPGTPAGIGAAVWFQKPAWRAELSGQAYWGATTRYDALPTIGAQLQLFTATVRGCPVARVGAVEFPLCFGIDVGFLRGEGFGVDQSETSRSLWAAAVFGPAVRLPVTEVVSFWFETEGVVPFLRPSLGVRNLGTLYAASRESARIWAGCEFRLLR